MRYAITENTTVRSRLTRVQYWRKSRICNDGNIVELLPSEDVSYELTSMFLSRNKPGASCFRGCLGTAGRRTPIVRLGTRALSSPTGEHKLPIVENTTHCKGPLDTESTPLGESEFFFFFFTINS